MKKQCAYGLHVVRYADPSRCILCGFTLPKEWVDHIHLSRITDVIRVIDDDQIETLTQLPDRDP
ncbi:MAG: hypothetical protein B7Z62_00295 [Deltaproteobacteria bacterium 37-65-8]|nr:MAG: hypothetical protein B7Z62_00295 [Deltaproteobacteria bacterium 37-65-8]